MGDEGSDEIITLPEEKDVDERRFRDERQRLPEEKDVDERRFRDETSVNGSLRHA
eukprot:CAMPEP_0175984736 /NCGR_PEP_ID=MMETSP0108-20121206/49170_1 /TAXON_ID=195067 ORGANISM="Goniomonas pacifica, Strain CCMP1869" /NCGR_SAMPLE_ID=MMETSP0108 /ASSEMBLY_ACC=CAM_ASM_000204 /LENGTH=54 /DNA_ID=CAMNT_0017315637 /DNA_START=18 /DNA_END=178 /DNA_ORIENTATION=-